MIVSHKHRFAYMAPPKTGTTSMVDHLLTHYEGIKWETTKNPNGGIDHHDMGLKKEWSDYFVFATVRNPYTHELSMWDYMKMRRVSWEDHMKHNCESLYVTLKQHEEYEPPPGCVKFKLNDYVRMEHMQEDFEKLPFANNTKIGHLNKYSLTKQFNKSPTKSYPPYTEEMVEIMKVKRKMDFDTFGYSTECLFTSTAVSLA